MKTFLVGCVGTILMCNICLAADKSDIKSETDRINYSIGYQMGGDFRRQHWELKPEVLTQGMRDAMNSTEPLMAPTEMNVTLQDLKKRLVVDQQAAAKKADAAFLADNATKEGVVVLPSGIQYKVIKNGTGRQPTLQDSVTIQYRVTRVDGQTTPTSNPEGKPATYPLAKALPGLQEVLQLMKEGSVWQIVLPPGPALGSRGEALERAGVLLYELELVSVQAGK
jgi:FKBP-type peptidyl-prolyl cis-trans isomerase FklB